MYAHRTSSRPSYYDQAKPSPIRQQTNKLRNQMSSTSTRLVTTGLLRFHNKESTPHRPTAALATRGGTDPNAAVTVTQTMGWHQYFAQPLYLTRTHSGLAKCVWFTASSPAPLHQCLPSAPLAVLFRLASCPSREHRHTCVYGERDLQTDRFHSQSLIIEYKSDLRHHLIDAFDALRAQGASSASLLCAIQSPPPTSPGAINDHHKQKRAWT